jgi:hypothetical protein
MDAVDRLIKWIPGGEIAAIGLGLDEGFAGWLKKGQRGIDSMKRLFRDAEKFGISPQFLQAMERTMGPDAEYAILAIDKIADAQGKLRSGDVGLSRTLSPYLDVKQFANNDSVNALLMLADAYDKYNNQVDRLNLSGSVVGNKNDDNVHNLLAGGSKAILDNFRKLNGSARFDPQTQAAIKVASAADRELQFLRDEEDAKKARFKVASDILEYARKAGKIGLVEYYQSLADVGLESQGMRDPDATNAIINQFLRQRKVNPNQSRKPVDHAANARMAETRDATEAIQKMTDELKLQGETFGMTTGQVAAYQARIKNVPNDLINAMLAQEKMNEELKKSHEISERAKSVQEDLQTPMEKVNAQFSKLAELGNLLTAEQHMLQQGKILSEAFGLENLLNKPAGAGSAPLALQGTQEAFAAIERARNSGVRSPADISQEEIRDAVKAQVDLDREKRDLLKKIANEKAKVFQIPN